MGLKLPRRKCLVNGLLEFLLTDFGDDNIGYASVFLHRDLERNLSWQTGATHFGRVNRGSNPNVERDSSFRGALGYDDARTVAGIETLR